MNMIVKEYLTCLQEFERSFSSEYEIPIDVLQLILRGYSNSDSKDLLDGLVRRDNELIRKFEKLAHYPELLMTIFLEQLYSEQLEAAGATLLLLLPIVESVKELVDRYIAISMVKRDCSTPLSRAILDELRRVYG